MKHKNEIKMFFKHHPTVTVPVNECTSDVLSLENPENIFKPRKTFLKREYKSILGSPF